MALRPAAHEHQAQGWEAISSCGSTPELPVVVTNRTSACCRLLREERPVFRRRGISRLDEGPCWCRRARLATHFRPPATADVVLKVPPEAGELFLERDARAGAYTFQGHVVSFGRVRWYVNDRGAGNNQARGAIREGRCHSTAPRHVEAVVTLGQFIVRNVHEHTTVKRRPRVSSEEWRLRFHKGRRRC